MRLFTRPAPLAEVTLLEVSRINADVNVMVVCRTHSCWAERSSSAAQRWPQVMRTWLKASPSVGSAGRRSYTTSYSHLKEPTLNLPFTFLEDPIFELLHFHCSSELRCCIAISNTSSSEPRTTRSLVSNIASSPGDNAAWGSTC